MSNAHVESFHFFVDNKKFDTDQPNLSGAAIKTVAAVPGNYQLFLEEHGSGPDRAISDGETVDLHNPPKHLYAVPPATFGHS